MIEVEMRTKKLGEDRFWNINNVSFLNIIARKKCFFEYGYLFYFILKYPQSAN